MSSTAAPEKPPLLSPAVAAFIQSGLSITVAGRGERLVPSIAKAVGCRVDADLRALSVLLFADAAEAICRDIAKHGVVAVCFSRPSTHETVQIKGRDARVTLASAQDMAAARHCLDLLLDDLCAGLGFRRPMLEAVFWHDPADLMCIRFTPDAAFAQTPGPSAGEPIRH